MTSVAPTATPDKSDEENQNLNLDSLDTKSNINSANLSISSAKSSVSSTEKIDGKPNGNSLSLQKHSFPGANGTTKTPGNSFLPYGFATINRNSPRQNPPSAFYRKEVLVPPALDDPVDSSNVSWQKFSVTLYRSAIVGFGIAISGGRDNPLFISGDPSIVVQEIVPSGPAAGLVQVGDRILEANGVKLENADYATAVSIMQDAQQLNMIVKRRVPVPFIEFEQRTLKFTLSKSRKKDDFGIVLGCRYYIKEITNPKLAEKDPGLKEGDVVLKINGQGLDGITLEEATRWLQRSREKLSLVVQRDVRRGHPGSRWSSQNTVYERLGSVSATPRHSPTPMHYTHSANPEMINSVRKFSDQMNSKRLSDPMTRVFEYTPHQQSVPPGYVPRSPLPSYNGIYCESPRPIHQSVTLAGPLRNNAPGSQTASNCSSPRLFSANHRPEIRVISFKKGSGSLGIRVIGGNQVGIFVSAVQDDSPAALNGIRIGDRILQVNNYPMDKATREQAVEFLLSLGDDVQIKVESSFDDFLTVRNNQIGDNFFIRTHFSHSPSSSKKNVANQLKELSFTEGDILRVTDTLYGGSVGQWKVQKLYSANGNEIKQNEEVGIVPNSKSAEIFAKQSRTESSTLGRSLFKKKLQSRRTKSLSTAVEEEFSNGSNFDIPLPAYERVALKQPTFSRPVVLFGPLADVAKQLLLANFSMKFAPVGEDSSKMITLSQVDGVMSTGKHGILSVSPGSVERLHLAQYAPIVILIDTESRSRVRDLRGKSGIATASARKLIEQAQKIKKHHSHLLTATLDVTKEDNWFDALRQLIFHLQERRVWMPELPPEKPLNELLLFPMQNAESDADSLKGEYGTLSQFGKNDYGTSNQFELRNQLYPQTTTGSSNSNSNDPNFSTKNDLSRFPDDLSNLNLGSNYSNNRNGNFYSAFSKNSPYSSYSNRSNYGSSNSPYDPFMGRDRQNGQGTINLQNIYDPSKQLKDFETSSSTLQGLDENRSRQSSSPYQTPIRHEIPISNQIAQNRNAFFEKTRPREHSRTPESSADYRIATLSADDKSTRSNYDPPFIDDKALNLDTERGSSNEDSSFRRANQVKEHVSGLVDWTGGTLTCPESGVELCVPENAIPFGTEQHIFVEVCEEGPQNPPLSKKEALLSPLVVCGPQGLEFGVPVELRLPHKFTSGDPTASNVVLKSGQGSKWTNIELLQPPKSDPNSKFVSVLVKHF
ncbi:hypothetical protein FO519_005893 [Halicephalobus sp. NKZ332]|nr:hypothetical protein FO519_005893 [Halicephalobus sp. NKZ332]